MRLSICALIHLINSWMEEFATQLMSIFSWDCNNLTIWILKMLTNICTHLCHSSSQDCKSWHLNDVDMTLPTGKLLGLLYNLSSLEILSHQKKILSQKKKTKKTGFAIRADFQRLYSANAKTSTCCPSDDNRTKVTNSVTSARSLWWHVGPYFWPADLTRTANPFFFFLGEIIREQSFEDWGGKIFRKYLIILLWHCQVWHQQQPKSLELPWQPVSSASSSEVCSFCPPLWLLQL